MRRLGPATYSTSRRVLALVWERQHPVAQTTPVRRFLAFRRDYEFQLQGPLAPAVTRRQVLFAFLLWDVPTVVFINTYQLVVLGVGRPLSGVELVDRLYETAMKGPVTEELLFRLLPWGILSNFGVVAGTIAWVIQHPFLSQGGVIRLIDTGLTGESCQRNS